MRISSPTYPDSQSTLHRLLYNCGGLLCAINLGLFLLLHLVALMSHYRLLAPSAAVDLLYQLRLPASLDALVLKPWTLLSYMFVQYEFGHLLLNLLWLWAFAFIISSRGSSARSIFSLYLIGGVAGAAAYIAFAPAGAPGLVGASAAITSLMGWVLAVAPLQKARLLLVGDVALWIVVSLVLLIFMFGGHSGSAGGLAAHIAGLVAGCLTGLLYRLRNRNNLRHRISTAAAGNMSPDDLLDKVRRSGYGSLTRAERARLFQVSSHPENKESR